MKKFYYLFVITLGLLSCSDSSDDQEEMEDINPSQFAMTANINGTSFKGNDPLCGNCASSTTVYNYFPEDEYIMLQAWDSEVGFQKSISIWLKKSLLAVGTYEIPNQTFENPSTHFIELVDITTSHPEETYSGTLKITELNTSNKIVQGTFEFETIDYIGDPNQTITVRVTDGTFSYKYE
tara:strand:+ start:3180 stop:3719 length:540 start_codon:yes stop_codon:yes gene_type:complete